MTEDQEVNLVREKLDLETELSVWLQHLKPSSDNAVSKHATMLLVDLFSQFDLPLESVNLLIILVSNTSLHEFLRHLSSLIERTAKLSKAPAVAHPTSRHDVLPPISLDEEERHELDQFISPHTTDQLFDTDSDNMFEHTRLQVTEALRELSVITTHDDNLERQYKEVCAQCSKLFSDLDRAKREVFKLRGKISIAEMTPEKIRIEMNRQREKDFRGKQSEVEIHDSRTDGLTEVLGECGTRGTGHITTRRNTLPGPIPVTRIPKKRAKHTDIPPPLDGCQCSVCRSVQGLGSVMLIPTGLETIQSGQQVMLGDRIIVKGQRPGTIRYLGKLEGHRTEIDNEVFAGVQLDHPAGRHNGTFNGRRYFSCPPRHGVFVPLRDVICVTSRALMPHTSSLALKKAKRRQEAEDRARRQLLVDQETTYQEELRELKEKGQMLNRLEDVNVLSIETPLVSSKKPGRKELLESAIQTEEKARQLRSMDFSKSRPDSEIQEMRTRMDSLLEKSRSIYDEIHPSQSIGSRDLQPESLSSYLRSTRGEEETGRQGRRDITISGTV